MKNNIELLSLNQCVGCRSCEQSCPKSCISMREDKEGFIFPHVNENCINCGLCVKNCPILTPYQNKTFSIERYAIISKNKAILNNSSSGGAFGGIAYFVLKNKGVVFGAAYDKDLKVKQTPVIDKSELSKIQGSKYVTCNTENSFSQVKQFLESGKTVLYGGNPCQIAGLRAFLGKEYDNLYTMDLICHGVPSEKLFQRYLEWVGKKTHGKVIYYGFRDKDIAGWSCGGKTLIKTKTKTKVIEGICDPYYAAFLRCETYRESCYTCPFAKSNNRIGDITMGDFWGTDKDYPSIPSKNGISFCTINTEQGKRLFESVKDFFDVYEVPADETLKVNIAYNQQSLRPEVRSVIYNNIDSDLFSFFRKFRYEKYPILIVKKAVRKICPSFIWNFLKYLLKGAK